MKNGKKTSVLIISGVFVPIIAGIALIVAGGVTGSFNIAIAGVVVLVGGELLTIVTVITVYIIKNRHTLMTGYEIEINKYVLPEDEPQSEEWKKLGELMDKEAALIAGLEQSGKLPLLKQYKDEAEPLWERYTGDFWDENLQQIDGLIDKYNALK